MNPTIHTFDKSHEKAKLYEVELDKYFEQAYRITPATREQERAGVDRFFEHLVTGVQYSVEYKTDHETPRTGNVFVETMSMETTQKLGWAYTSLAQVLVYFVPGQEYALRADMTAIKRCMSKWSVYREATAWNRSRSGEYYRTLGRLVPVGEFRGACVQVHDVATPLDASDDFTGALTICKHDMPPRVCKVCNGTARALIGRTREANL